MVVRTCAYLSSRCLSILLWPLTSGVFLPSTQLLLTGYSLHSAPSSVNPREDCDGVEIPADQQFTTFKDTPISFLPRSNARFELQQVGCATSACQNALGCSLVVSCFAICGNSEQFSWTCWSVLLWPFLNSLFLSCFCEMVRWAWGLVYFFSHARTEQNPCWTESYRQQGLVLSAVHKLWFYLNKKTVSVANQKYD